MSNASVGQGGKRSEGYPTMQWRCDTEIGVVEADREGEMGSEVEERVWVQCGAEDFYVDIKREEASVGMSGRIPVGTARSPRVAREAVVLFRGERAELRQSVAKVNQLLGIKSDATEIRNLQARICELTEQRTPRTS